MSDITKRISAAANIAKKVTPKQTQSTAQPQKLGRKKQGEGRTNPVTSYLSDTLFKKLQKIRAIAMENGHFNFTQSSAMCVALHRLPIDEKSILAAIESAKDELTEKD